jgi:protein-tyrosine phosphatase
MVERLLQRGLDHIGEGQFLVQSAGTQALIGRPIDPPVATLLNEMGVHSDSFAAQQVTSTLLNEQDVIIALTRDHRTRIVTTEPKVLRRTVLLVELAQFLQGREASSSSQGPAERWATAISSSLRSSTRSQSRSSSVDIADPFQQGNKVHADVAQQIETAVMALVEWEARRKM